MLDPINMEAYGASTPLNQCGTVNVPDPRMITVNIWDKSLVNAAEKAIRESGLGINPVIDGTIIRLPIPRVK
jgi:ribosome recycling factor